MTVYSILLNIAMISLLPPIGMGVYRIKTLHREMKFFVLYLIIALITAVLVNWFTGDQWTWIIINITTLIEYIVIMSMILIWQESLTMKRVMTVLLWVYILFWFTSKISFEPMIKLNSITLSISQVILALSAGYTLFVVIENHAQPLLRSQLFWMLIAFILNYTGTLIPTALGGVFFTQPGEALILLYSINWVLVIISNILFTIGILCLPVQQSLS
jgi:hypothetical protein